MKEINLLKSETRRKSFSGKFLSEQLAIWTLAGILLLSLAAYGFFQFLKSQRETELGAVRAAIAEVENKMQSPPPELANAVRSQSALKYLEELLNRHTYWTHLWDELGNHTSKSAQYFNIAATADKSDFIIEGRVSNFEELGKLMLGLQNSANFINVQLVSSGPSKGKEKGIEFSIDVKYNPELLLDKSGSGEH
jgi:Tfp pilus assembly protein PilN